MLDEVVLQGAGVSKAHVQTFSEHFAFLMGLAAAGASRAAPGQAAPRLQPQPPPQACGSSAAVAAGSAAAPAAGPGQQVLPTVPGSDDGMGEDDLSGPGSLRPDAGLRPPHR